MKLTASLPLKIAGKGRLRSFLFGVSAISWGTFAVFVLGYQYHGHAKVFLSRFKQLKKNNPRNKLRGKPTNQKMHAFQWQIPITTKRTPGKSPDFSDSERFFCTMQMISSWYPKANQFKMDGNGETTWNNQFLLVKNWFIVQLMANH